MSVNPRINITTINSIETKTACFNGVRYYDPSLQRFLGEDPIGFTSGDTNFYRYVGNSPINFIDPSGKFGVAGAFAGAVVGVISSFISPCGDFGFQGWINLGLNVGVGAALGAVGAGINYGLSSSCRDKPSCE